jgi:hypothetical protein
MIGPDASVPSRSRCAQKCFVVAQEPAMPSRYSKFDVVSRAIHATKSRAIHVASWVHDRGYLRANGSIL